MVMVMVVMMMPGRQFHLSGLPVLVRRQHVVHMVMDAGSHRAMKPPGAVRHSEPDEQDAGEIFHAFADRLHQLQPEEQADRSKQYGHSDVTETARSRNQRRPPSAPSFGSAERSKRHPVIGSERVKGADSRCHAREG